MDKQALKTELIAQLEATLATARIAHASAIEGSTHEEARAENDKDTRGLEQSYLARGQAQRVAELEAAVGDVTALALRTFMATSVVALSALVTIDEDAAQFSGGELGRKDPRIGADADTRTSYSAQFFIAPAGGGCVLAGGVQVVTPSSPLGRALLGKRIDDEVELQLPGKLRSFAITSIR